MKNGHMMDKSVLQDDPFETIGSITELFTMEKAIKIVGVIEEINRNAIEVAGA